MVLSKSGNAAVQRYCSIALANISGQGKLQSGSVGALVRLLKAQDTRERLGGAAGPGSDGEGEGVNKKAAVQAKFRRLLMAATLAKELNETASSGSSGGGEGSGTEGQTAASSSSTEQQGDGGASSASTAAAAPGGGAKRANNGEKERDEEEGEGDEEAEEEQRRLDDERDKEAFYQATKTAIADAAETAAAGMDMVWHGQQKPSLAAWDITPPPHETVFYKCNQIGPVLLSEEGESGGTAAVGGDRRASMAAAGGGGAGSIGPTEGEGAAMGRASVAAPRAKTPTRPSTTLFPGAAAPTASSQPPPLDNVIVVRHPKLQTCLPLRSRELQQRSSGASTPAAAFLLERRKTTLMSSLAVTASPTAGGPKQTAGGEDGKTIAGAAGMLASRWKARKAASASPSPPRTRESVAPSPPPPSPPPPISPSPSAAAAAALPASLDGNRKSLASSSATATATQLTSSESAARRSLSSSTTPAAGPGADIMASSQAQQPAQPEERGLVATHLPVRASSVPASLAHAPSRLRPRQPTQRAATAADQRVMGQQHHHHHHQPRRPLPVSGPPQHQQRYRIDPELLREAFSYGARPCGGNRSGQGQGRSASPPRRRGGGSEERARRRLVLK